MATGAKLHWNRAPTRMPINRDEKASLVIRARTMATTGGIRAQKVPYILDAAASPSAAKAGKVSKRLAAMTSSMLVHLRWVLMGHSS